LRDSSQPTGSKILETNGKRYKKQIDWRRNKVRELLVRGYTQYEIGQTLHISQPTISRDIRLIYDDSINKSHRLHPDSLYRELKITLDGLSELLRKLWSIIDDPKTLDKEKMKAIALIADYYNMRWKFLASESFVKEYKNHADQLKIMEEDISKREKAIQAVIHERDITQKEIDSALEQSDIDSNRVF
jgi:hypothetical protein